MEWLCKDSLLQKKDTHVLKFSPMPSTVLTCNTGSAAVRLLKTDGDWQGWLEQQEERGGAAQSGLTLMLGGRKKCRFEGGECSYLPFSDSNFFCERIVPMMKIQGSISRVINRNTTATFSAVTTGPPSHDRPSLVYICRSSAEWSGDMALTVTYSPENKSTQAVVFGCSNTARETFINRLGVCDFKVYHPLTIPTIFAELERERHFGLVNPLITELVNRAVNMSMISGYTKSTGSEQSTKIRHDPGLMRLWLKVSYLKRGMEAWRQQLEKMITHCEELTHSDLHVSDRTFDDGDSAGSTPVNAILSIDVSAKTNEADGQSDELRDLEYSGSRIHRRLMELKCEYDEKIRNCSTIVEGMTLAAQLEWNQIGQVDAQTNLEISKYNLDIATATGNDSKQMRSIAVLTMIFLPATFVASLFSMSFFDLGPEQGSGNVSPWIWLYFVVTAGFTGVTVSAWYVCTKVRPARRYKQALSKNDVESQPSLAIATAPIRKDSTGR